jgi:predicted DCC family thiol-disulfide oxidoreductase YuxK
MKETFFSEAGPLFEVFFDGNCPLCRREIDFLRRRDKRTRLTFTDIAAAEFDASRYGLTMNDFMAQIRGRQRDGRWVQGVEVFRQLYAAVGFRWAVRISRLPGLSWLLDVAYGWFAKNRLRLTGRKEPQACSCSVPTPTSEPKRAA